MSGSKTVLMCPPKFFDIEYEINAWMHKSNPVDHKLATKQWLDLYDTYTQKIGWDVQLIDPVEGLPDMVFTANGGLVYGGKVILPRFKFPQRQPETERFKKWFSDAGFSDIYMPKYNFEGAGDAFLWQGKFLGGYPQRSDKRSHQEIAEYLGLKSVSLELINPRFYHLDTAITFLSEDTVAIYPKAFSADSLRTLHEIVPNLIEATDEDAHSYGLNAMHDGQNVILSDHPSDLTKKYKQLGMNVYSLDMSEFQKSGGGVKCLTLELG